MKRAMTLLGIALRPNGIRWYAVCTWSGQLHISGSRRNGSSAPALESKRNAPQSNGSWPAQTVRIARAASYRITLRCIDLLRDSHVKHDTLCSATGVINLG